VSWFARRRTPLFVQTLALAVIGAAGWALYSSDAAVKGRERESRLAEARASGEGAAVLRTRVDVVSALRRSEAREVELSGVLEPARATWVSAEVAGSIVEIPAAEHAFVEEGEVLVRLDASLPRAELIRAQASYDLALAELERQRQLGTRSVASESELDRARAEERRRYAALLEARTRLADTEIVAPFDGLVNSLDLDPGAYVSPGTPIAEVLDVALLELTLPVSDRQVGAIAVGALASVRVDALGNEGVAGRVVRKGGAPQTETQRYPVVLSLDNASGTLLPGMLAHAMLEVGTAPAIRLPASAVIREFELDYVFVVDANGRVRRTRVSTRPVPFRPERVEVLDGLEDGAKVVVSGVSQLRDGAEVEIQP